MYDSPDTMFVFWVRKRLNGREKEFGICPDERPGRGSGSVPRNLSGCERGSAEDGGRSVPSTGADTKDQFGSRVKAGTVRHHLFIAQSSGYCIERNV